MFHTIFNKVAHHGFLRSSALLSNKWWHIERHSHRLTVVTIQLLVPLLLNILLGNIIRISNHIAYHYIGCNFYSTFKYKVVLMGCMANKMCCKIEFDTLSMSYRGCLWCFDCITTHKWVIIYLQYSCWWAIGCLFDKNRRVITGRQGISAPCFADISWIRNHSNAATAGAVLDSVQASLYT